MDTQLAPIASVVLGRRVMCSGSGDTFEQRSRPPEILMPNPYRPE